MVLDLVHTSEAQWSHEGTVKGLTKKWVVLRPHTPHNNDNNARKRKECV